MTAPTARFVKAAATVNVAKGDFQSIEVGVDPATVGLGLSGKVRVEAITSDGKHYNLLESSQLKTDVSPELRGQLAARHAAGPARGQRPTGRHVRWRVDR